MSKASKQSIFLLIFLLLASIAFCGYLVFDKQQMEKDKQTLELQLDKAKKSEQDKNKELIEAKDKLQLAETAKIKIETDAKAAQAKADEIIAKTDELTKDRDKWKSRVDEITKERDNLVAKMQIMVSEGVTAKEPGVVSEDAKLPDDLKALGINQNEEYWASLLKEKASLQIKLDALKDDLSKKSMEIVDLKQINADLQIEMDSLKNNKHEIDRDIKYKEDLINSLSLELARTKNDKKYIADRIIDLNNENNDLRGQLKQLVSTKTALEKTIVQIKDDKQKLERRLNETDNMVQSKIDEIWEIKESLDRAFQKTSLSPSATIDLDKIVVSQGSKGEGSVLQAIGDVKEASNEPDLMVPGFQGRVVSVNEENNFVIVDLGEQSGIRLNDVISVYRDSKYIARLEVIQVRKDICAADIKEQWSKINVGDTVK